MSWLSGLRQVTQCLLAPVLSFVVCFILLLCASAFTSWKNTASYQGFQLSQNIPQDSS